jgi:hypothetical protein
MIASVGAGFALRVWQSDAPRGRSLGRLLTYAQLLPIGYGLVLMLLLGPSLSYPRVQTFCPTLVIFGHVLAGLWLGRFFIDLAITVTALLPVTSGRTTGTRFGGRRWWAAGCD